MRAACRCCCAFAPDPLTSLDRRPLHCYCRCRHHRPCCHQYCQQYPLHQRWSPACCFLVLRCRRLPRQAPLRGLPRRHVSCAVSACRRHHGHQRLPRGQPLTLRRHPVGGRLRRNRRPALLHSRRRRLHFPRQPHARAARRPARDARPAPPRSEHMYPSRAHQLIPAQHILLLTLRTIHRLIVGLVASGVPTPNAATQECCNIGVSECTI